MDMDIADEAELEQELENELMEELLEAEGIEDAEFAAEEAAYDSQPLVRRTKRGIPSLRVGFAGASGKQRLTKRQIADEFGLEDLGFAEFGDMDEAEAEAIEEILQEIEDEEAAEKLADEYDVVTSTSTSAYARPTSSPKRPSAGLGSATVEGSSNVVPVYNGPITYAVPKTGYYCVGKLPFSRSDSMLNHQQASFPSLWSILGRDLLLESRRGKQNTQSTLDQSCSRMSSRESCRRQSTRRLV